MVRAAHRTHAERCTAELAKAKRRIRALEEQVHAAAMENERVRTEHGEDQHRSSREVAEMGERLARAGQIAERERRGRLALEEQLKGARASETSTTIATLQKSLVEADAHVQRAEKSRYGYSPTSEGGVPCRWPVQSQSPQLAGRELARRVATIRREGEWR